jgi:D-glycero-alpha-D-manno-heptose 1-phosphate guanylyltransferase
MTPNSTDGLAGGCMPALLLVGGMGTRLKSVVSSKPKPLAPVGNAPFLELLLLQLRAQGIHRVVMCSGYLAEQIEEQFGDGGARGMAITYSKETRPLGTAGAVKLAEGYLHGDSDFVVMNGDSFLEVDLHRLIQFHREHGALITIAARMVPDAARYGTVRVDKSNRIAAFEEKRGAAAPGLISGGVYVFNHSVLNEIPGGPGSLETDVFPRLLERGLFAVPQAGIFIDIGTPEDYAKAQTLRSSLQQAVSG